MVVVNAPLTVQTGEQTGTHNSTRGWTMKRTILSTFGALAGLALVLAVAGWTSTGTGAGCMGK